MQTSTNDAGTYTCNGKCIPTGKCCTNPNSCTDPNASCPSDGGSCSCKAGGPVARWLRQAACQGMQRCSSEACRRIRLPTSGWRALLDVPSLSWLPASCVCHGLLLPIQRVIMPEPCCPGFRPRTPDTTFAPPFCRLQAMQRQVHPHWQVLRHPERLLGPQRFMPQRWRRLQLQSRWALLRCGCIKLHVRGCRGAQMHACRGIGAAYVWVARIA